MATYLGFMGYEPTFYKVHRKIPNWPGHLESQSTWYILRCLHLLPRPNFSSLSVLLCRQACKILKKCTECPSKWTLSRKGQKYPIYITWWPQRPTFHPFRSMTSRSPNTFIFPLCTILIFLLNLNSNITKCCVDGHVEVCLKKSHNCMWGSILKVTSAPNNRKMIWKRQRSNYHT